MAEAQALYVRQLRLPERLRGCPDEFVIWDVGLGAAGNPATALQACADCSAKVRIVSFDRTTEALAFALNHTGELGFLRPFTAPLQALIKQPATPVAFRHSQLAVHWELHCGDFPDLMHRTADELHRTGRRRIAPPDAIFFDAFSPARNPEMWTLPLLRNLYSLLDPTRPCSLATFSRSTLARASLLLAGFFVGRGETVAGKEETTVAANTPALLHGCLDEAWLARARRSHSAEPLREPVYRQQPLTRESITALEAHPQFRGA